MAASGTTRTCSRARGITAIGGKTRRSAEITDSAEFDPEGLVANCSGELLGGHDMDVKPTGIARIFRRIPAVFDAIFGHKRLLTITADKALFGNRQLFHEGGSARITAPYIEQSEYVPCVTPHATARICRAPDLTTESRTRGHDPAKPVTGG